MINQNFSSQISKIVLVGDPLPAWINLKSIPTTCFSEFSSENFNSFSLATRIAELSTTLTLTFLLYIYMIVLKFSLC